MLTSSHNPLIKQIRKLRQAKERHAQQRFLLEGTHLLQEAHAVGYPLEVVCCTPEWQERQADLWQQVARQAQRTEVISPEVMASVATTVHPDGVLAVAPRQQSLATAGASVEGCRPSLGLALETIQDPGNLGTIIRTAAAAGAEGLWTNATSVDLDHPKVLRSSAGQWFRLAMTVCPNLLDQVQHWQLAGLQIVATQANADQTYWDIDLSQPSIILLGNEGAGLSLELLAAASVTVRIPLEAAVESLNVGVTAALMLYEARRQRTLKQGADANGPGGRNVPVHER